MTPANKFMQELYALASSTSKYAVNPEDDEEYIINDAVALDMRPLQESDSYIHFISVRAVNPGKGAGSRAMKKVMDLADTCGVTLVGKIIPYHSKDLSSEDLRKWYKKMGCHPLDSNNEDGIWVRGPYGTKKNINLGFVSKYKVLNGLSNQESKERLLFYIFVVFGVIMLFKKLR